MTTTNELHPAAAAMGKGAALTACREMGIRKPSDHPAYKDACAEAAVEWSEARAAGWDQPTQNQMALDRAISAIENFPRAADDPRRVAPSHAKGEG